MKKKILIFSDWFVPAYKAGGPVKSIYNLVMALREEYNLYVVCGDRDLHDKEPFKEIALNEWLQKDGYQVFYLAENRQKLQQYKEIIGDLSPDWLYFNSLFSLRFTLLPLLVHKLIKQGKRRVLLAPRGMLGNGALQLKKQKKGLFLFFARSAGLFKDIVWHATSAVEEKEIKAHFPSANCRIAENISGLSQGDASRKPKRKEQGELNLFFLSRISPKKNLSFALNRLLDIDQGCKINFTIFGPIEDEAYWHTCQELMYQLAQKGSVYCRYQGAVPNHLLIDVLDEQHFLFLPTLNENYGHVIVESWLAGCPVIISDQTPWQMLAEKKIGWSIDLLKPETFKKVLQAACHMDELTYAEWSTSALQWGARVATSEDVVDRSRQLFR